MLRLRPSASGAAAHRETLRTQAVRCLADAAPSYGHDHKQAAQGEPTLMDRGGMGAGV